MIEIRIHGRGGQGNVVAAYLLATAAFEEGRHCQAFPSFGAERRGAPVASFVRIDESPIKRRDQVKSPAFLIVQDPSLLHIPSVMEGLHPEGGIMVNSTLPAEEWAGECVCPVITVPAARMAQDILGRPMPNVALLSAFLTATGLLKRESLGTALGERFKGEVLNRNLTLIDSAAETVTAGQWKERLDATRA